MRRTRLPSIAAIVATLAMLGACSAANSGRTDAGEAEGDILNDPVQFTIPFGTGGGMDLAGRTVADVLESNGLVDVPIQITNRDGAGGSVGLTHMVRDLAGQENAIGIIATHIISTPLVQGTDVDGDDITPLARLFAEYVYVLVKPDSDITSIEDVAKRLKADPKSLRIGGASTGASGHLTMAKFARDIGIKPTDLIYVAHDGNEAIPALLGGHVDIGLGGPDVLDLVKAGEMRAIAVSSPEELAGPSEGIPTFTDKGYDAVHANWRLMFGPPDMPQDAVEFWKGAFTEMSKTEDWKKAMENNGWSDYFTTEGLEEFIEEENKDYQSLLTDLGLIGSGG